MYLKECLCVYVFECVYVYTMLYRTVATAKFVIFKRWL